MKELSSYHLRFHRPLKTKQIMNIYKLISKTNDRIYFHQNELIADGAHLSKLLSFFFFVNIDKPILLIIDSENVESTFEQIEEYIGDAIAEVTCRTKYNEALMNSNTSISV